MAKFPWQRTETSGTEEITLPDELVGQIKAGAEAAGKLSKIEEMLSGLSSIVQSDRADRESEKQERAAAAHRETAASRQVETDAELEELIITNPKEAIRRATEGQSSAILTLRADNIRREVFEDAEKFKYYHGAIKSEVDAFLAAQTLTFRNDPASVANCYHAVLGKHTDEIVEGKLKQRFGGAGSGNGGTSTGSAGDSGTGGSNKRSISSEYEADIRRAAKHVGIKYDDYVEMLDKEGVL